MLLTLSKPCSVETVLNLLDEASLLSEGREKLSAIKERELRALTSDSREVEAGSIFIAYRGMKVDGHDYIPMAIERNATLILVEDLSGTEAYDNVIQVKNGRQAISLLSDWGSEHPTRDLLTVGITGTNGKTTILWLLSEIMDQLNHSVLRAGTLGVTHREKSFMSGEFTTPPAEEIHSFAREALGEKATAYVMEVSSHSLSQLRVEHVDFDAVIFTNFSSDHLDYHKNLENYLLAKRHLFELIKENRESIPCITGYDDPETQRIYKWCKEEGFNPKSFGFSNEADVQVVDLTLTPEGFSATLNERSGRVILQSPLIGSYNALNVAAAFLTLRELGFGEEEVLELLRETPNPPGRMELFKYNRDHIDASIFVDYAHTPDALEKALKALRPVTEGELWLLFGIGGGKDPGRFPGMGKIARDSADKVVLTADNPRMVPIDEINREIMKSGLEPTIIEDDRSLAISQTINQLGDGDVLLIAGKGHEDFQIIGSEIFPFSDREEVLKSIGGG